LPPAPTSSPVAPTEFLYLDQRLPWDAQNELLEVMNIILETPDVKTFCFRTASNNWFNYAPGQFITLELPIAGQMVYRTYTLSSTPSRPIYLTITVKAQTGSYASRWMFDNLKVGMRVRAFGPAGEFHLYNHPAKKYCFISAGSGITPMMSMTSYLFDQGGELDASFIHCARRPSDIIFRSGLELMANRMPGLKLHWVVEERDLHSVWAGYVGRINKALLELSTPDYLEREVFCCGPAPFMQAVRNLLQTNGFDMQHYHEESFQAAVVQPEQPLSLDFEQAAEEVLPAQVSFIHSGQSIAANQQLTILQASIQAGLNIPSACQFGICGSCKVKCVSGEIQMAHSGGISERDIEEGYILACCSRPLSDVEILY
jgi:ferredoxin-NADP reductase